MMERTPPLVTILDRRAEAGDGARGCAMGSHACSGMRPALAPKPSAIKK